MRETKPGKITRLDSGGILLIVLIIMIVFIAMVTFTLSYINRQSHVIAEQKQEERIFSIAESGISFVAWLLDSGGGNYQPEDISALSSIIDHPIKDKNDNTIGFFTIRDITADNNIHTIQFTSYGVPVNATDKCQSIEAELYQREPGSPYKTTKWDHQTNLECP